MKGNVGVLIGVECEADEMAVGSTGEVQREWLLATWKLPIQREACDEFLGGDWEWREKERLEEEKEREEKETQRRGKEAEEAKKKMARARNCPKQKCPKCPKCEHCTKI